jgi:hypothetical protein
MKSFFVARERMSVRRASGYLVRVKWNCCVVDLLVKDSAE